MVTSTQSSSDTDRLNREAEFHDQWASGINADNTLIDETFSSVTAIENQHILSQFGDVKGKRVLDYGCGAGEGGIYLAKLGANVVGVDVSPGMLEAAHRLASAHGVTIETRQVTENKIPAADNEFDLIYGNGVLHHVDLSVAKRELARILKPDGIGCFIEPLTYNPAIEVYRYLARTVRTEDEKPLSFEDIESFNEFFDDVSHKEFWLTTLSVFFKFFLIDRAHPKKERYWKKVYTDAERVRWFFEPLKRLDDRVLDMVPPLRKLCWNSVITVRRPRR
jgi:2-polyprenyl-3-methyl-5-hydroxy-6-metoxy-1,4-benzoquinol methylase